MIQLKKNLARIAALLLLGATCISFTGKPSVIHGGTINNPYQSIPTGTTPALITATAASGCSFGSIYIWQRSNDGINFTSIKNTNSLNYQPGPISTTTYFRRLTYCLFKGIAYTTNVAKIAIFEAGCINNYAQARWKTDVPTTITATSATGGTGTYTYQWQSSTDSLYFKNIVGATSQNLTFTAPLNITTFFQRKDMSGEETQYTQRALVYVDSVVYTACAPFGLYLDSTSGSTGIIKSGRLKSTNTTLTVGEYVIDWYKDSVSGLPKFSSGSDGANDTTISATHPFAGEPAEGGVWHPVVKYVYVNGIKYSRTLTPWARYSPDLLHCLDTVIVTVNNLTCANGGSFYSAYGSSVYDHKITYTNGFNSPELAARSFKFDLDSSNKYFAWYFLGYQESDKIKISHIKAATSDTTILDWWQVGSNASWDVQPSFKKIPYPYMYKINSLAPFTYGAGDHLLIEITPSANSNTNWEFLCKCFSAVDCNIWDSTQRLIDTANISMVYDSLNCSYDLTYKKLAPPYTDASNSTFLKYNFSFYSGFGGSLYGQEYNDKVTLRMENKTYGYFYIAGDSYTCNEMADQASITKVDSTLTIVFNSFDDYNQYKNAYTALSTNPYMANYDTDSTKLNHYKFYTIYLNIGSSCGDNTGATYYYYVHYSNKPVFNDDTKTLTWNFKTKMNWYPSSGQCNSTSQSIQSYIAANNSATTGNIATVNTNLRRGDGIAGIYGNPYIVADTAKIFMYYRGFPSVDTNICNLSAKGFSGPYYNIAQQHYIYFYDKVTITNPADPTHNFKLERLIDANGMQITDPANYIKVYEILNGVIVP